MNMTTDYIVYQNRENGRFGYSSEEYAYKSDIFLNKRTVFIKVPFFIAEEIVKVMNNEIDD